MTTETSIVAVTTIMTGEGATLPPALLAAEGETRSAGDHEAQGPEAAVDGEAQRRISRGRPVPRQLYSIKETEEALGRSRATVWRLVSSGALDIVRIGSSTSVTAESLERVIREGAPTLPGRGRRPRPHPRRAATGAEIGRD